jgi:hypothetical protein
LWGSVGELCSPDYTEVIATTAFEGIIRATTLHRLKVYTYFFKWKSIFWCNTIDWSKCNKTAAQPKLNKFDKFDKLKKLKTLKRCTPSEHVSVNGKIRVVYIGPRGGKYVKLNGEYKSIKGIEEL